MPHVLNKDTWFYNIPLWPIAVFIYVHYQFIDIILYSLYIQTVDKLKEKLVQV